MLKKETLIYVYKAKHTHTHIYSFTLTYVDVKKNDAKKHSSRATSQTDNADS